MGRAIAAIIFIGLTVGSIIFSMPTEAHASTSCAGVKTSYFSCPNGQENPNQLDQTGFWKFLLTTITILTSLIVIVAVGGIVYGAIMYASAGDNEGQVQQAKTIIRDVILGIVVYAAMWSFAQYLIPGGIFT